MSIFNINFSARDNLRVAAGAGDEARPLERENVDIGLQQLGLGSAHWPLVTAVSSHRHGEGRQDPDMGAVFDNVWNTIIR